MRPFASSVVAVVIWKDEGIIVEANGALQALLGYGGVRLRVPSSLKA
jgi:PAS domain-containing protein